MVAVTCKQDECMVYASIVCFKYGFVFHISYFVIIYVTLLLSSGKNYLVLLH